jgi:hypothetical protein
LKQGHRGCQRTGKIRTKTDYSAASEAIALKTVSYYLNALRAESSVIAARVRTECRQGRCGCRRNNSKMPGRVVNWKQPGQTLEYQNEIQTLSENSTDFETAKLSLAQLINIGAGTAYRTYRFPAV